VKSWISRVRKRLSFANVASAIALFVAFGGTSYAAVTLPSNSVGLAQIKTGGVGKSEIGSNTVGSSEIRGSSISAPDIKTSAVGPSEVRANAIDSDEIADKGIKSADLADELKAELENAKSVTFRVAVNAAGTATGGAAKAVTHAAGSGVYSVDFGADVSKCQTAASVGGTGPGLVTVNPATTNVVTVSTFNGAAAPAPEDRPFNLLVAC
jgi:hypothetical protein